MSERPPPVAARLAWFGLAVLFTGWALHTALGWLAEVWWGIVIVLVIIAVIVGVVWWLRRDRW